MLAHILPLMVAYFFFFLYFFVGLPLFAVYVVCRRGNNSQLAVNKLKTYFKDCPPVAVKDIASGLEGWAQEVDSTFPLY